MFNSLLASGLTAQSFLICTAVSLVLGLLTALCFLIQLGWLIAMLPKYGSRNICLEMKNMPVFLTYHFSLLIWNEHRGWDG